MAKWAFLFPGQGSQYVGMGKDLKQNFKVAADVFAEAQQSVALIFSAKEALYKCIAALLERRIGFMDAVIVPDPQQGFFIVHLNEPVAAQLPRGLRLQGRSFFFAGAVFTGLVLA